ncbi:MAG: ABC transporter ATP-binding protein [Sphaerochaetaceae bacterium]|nr:ABC transporter ATP-binding protein [Sphaerochaetaceae bacterium]
MPVIELCNIVKSFQSGDNKRNDPAILDSVSLTVEKGESVAITGKSGTGKSTLLSIAGLLDRPTSGKVTYFGEDTSSFSEKKLASIRNIKTGFIFQANLLLEDFTALENVAFPAMISGLTANEAMKKASELINETGLSDRLRYYPSKLSGGEKQRLAVCRALINKPEIVFADEPTGSLDEENAIRVEEMLFDMVKRRDSTLILVTHNVEFASHCDKVYEIKNHRLNAV